MTTTSVGITSMLVKSLPLKQNPILMVRIKMLSLLERLVIMMAGFVQVIMSWLVTKQQARISMGATMKNNPVNKWVNNCKIINRRCCYIANLLTGLFLSFLSFVSPNKKDNQGVCHV